MTKGCFLLTILILAASAVATPLAWSQKRTKEQVRTERSATDKKINATRHNIDANKKSVQARLAELEQLEAESAITKSDIKIIERRIRKVRHSIKIISDTISILSNDIATLKSDAAAAAREARRMRKMQSAQAMIFSAKSFHEAVKRAGYLRQLDKSRRTKIKSLDEKLSILQSKKKEQSELLLKEAQDKQNLSERESKLHSQQNQLENIVQQLRRQATDLTQTLKQQQRLAQQLDQELQRIIDKEIEEARLQAQKEQQERERAAKAAEEARRNEQKKKQQAKEKTTPTEINPPLTKPEENTHTKKAKEEPTLKIDTQHLSTSFANNKGSLPSPISGNSLIISRFGRSTHENLSKVQVENSGIDILAQSDFTVRAVHPGVVTSIFYLNGMHNVVIVRHGEYLTVYANIDNLSVKKGDPVGRGDALGCVYKDPLRDNRAILHFEVRKEKEKLDPELWLRQ